MFKTFLLFLLYNLANSNLWSKRHLTYSIENDTEYTTQIDASVREWYVPSLEIKKTDHGKGDIKIYFLTNISILNLGLTSRPQNGTIYLNQNLITKDNIPKVIQHEFGHALGLNHSYNNSFSVMIPIYQLTNYITKTDLNNLNKLYKCRYDSVTLLNYQTYLKFYGTHYDRIDINTHHISDDVVWYPFREKLHVEQRVIPHPITKVTAMYRNNTYYIISNNKYFEFNNTLYFIREGYINDLFPHSTHNLDPYFKMNIQAVLTLRNSSIIAFFDNGYIWYDGIFMKQYMFNPYPDDVIQGAYEIFNKNIILTVKDYNYIYDKNFTFISKRKLCHTKILKNIHCCNKFSKFKY